jgi:hypothetical protein
MNTWSRGKGGGRPAHQTRTVRSYEAETAQTLPAAQPVSNNFTATALAAWPERDRCKVPASPSQTITLGEGGGGERTHERGHTTPA